MRPSEITPSCPAPQTIVRFVEGRLPRDEVDAVLRHLDLCDPCMEAVEVANEALAGNRRDAVPHRRRWWIAIAAAAVIAVVALFAVRPQKGMSRLIALAPRSERLVEPRLSGGFPWAAYRGPRRDDTAPDAARMKLIGAAGDAAERAQRDPAADAQHVAGVAMLLVDQPLAGEQSLKAALERAPRNAEAWSDLAAARYAAALHLGRTSLYPEALAAADAALRIDPRLPEALFNRALTLERLGLRDAARAAWQRYLEIDPSSAWSAEARAHLQALARSDLHSRFRRDLRQLESAAAAGDAARVREIVGAHPQDCRAFGEGEYLGRWGEAALRGDHREAQRHLVTAGAIGDALVAVNGETLLRDAVAAIAASSDRDALAGAHALYRKGRLLYARQQPSEAEKHLRQAASRFERGKSPMSRVARYFAANAAFDRQSIDVARRELTALLSEIPSGHAALAAQVRWQLALCAMYDGAWSDALALLRDSEAFFVKAGESVNAANVQSLLATTLAATGRPDEAWRSRIAAFETLSARANDEKLIVAAGSAARMELRGRPPRLDAAGALMRIEEALCRTRRNAVFTTDVLVRQAIVSEELGDHQSAERLVAAASAESAGIDDPDMRARAHADVLFARGAVRLRSQAADAGADLSRAVDAYVAAQSTFMLPEAYLLRARAARSRGDLESAALDLDRGIDALERHPVRHAGAVVGTGVLDAGRALFEAAIVVHLDRGDESAAFAYAERAHSASGTDGFGPPAAIEELQRRLRGSGTVVLELVALPSETIAFSIGEHGLRVARTPVRRERLGELSASADPEAMRTLYDVLIRPSARSLQAARTLIVVPDRALQNVALAALTDRESNVRLVERFAVAIAPRASALRTAQPRSTPLSLLAVALPSGETAGSAALPEGEREIREIGRHYDDASLLARESATFESFGSAAPRASVIHLAGHTQRRGERDAAFVFAGGERVSWRTIAAIRVPHDGIVVLAGCETLRAADAHEATKSLGEAFLAAGARAVIGTLAPIADRDARALFAALHRRLAAGIDEAEALRRVQLESIHDGSAWQSITLLTTRIPPG